MTESTDRSTMRHLILALAALALGVTACEGCRSSQAPGTVVPAAAAATPTLRLYLATDVAGALEPCGCTRDQLGGLGHLGAWMRQSRTAVPAAAFASVGPLFFMDEK